MESKDNIKLYIIDNENIQHKIISEWVKYTNYDILHFFSVGQFNKNYKAKDKEVFLIDMNLDDGNAYDIINKIKENKNYSILFKKLIIMSSENSVNIIEKSYKKGADDYLVKPLKKAELLSKLADCSKLFIENENIIRNSEKKTYENQLLEFIVNSIPLGIILTNSENKIEFINKHILTQTGYTREELIGKTQKIYEKKDNENDIINIRNKKISLKVNFEETIKDYKKNGDSWWNNIQVFPFHASSGEIKYLSIQTDVTEKIIENQKNTQIHKLATMGEISANMAHELNQPLNAIRMGVANIKRRISKVDEKDSIDLVEISNRLSRIDAQVSRAATIIDHMRQFGRKDVDIKPFKVNDVVENVRNFIIETCRLGEIQLETQLPDEDLYVEGQWIKLEQVILNITKNAQDQILMSKNLFPKKLIIIVKKNKEDKIIISIEDSGGGIPEDILPSIFDPFFTTKSENEGTGLGLSISREIIQEMNGDIMAVNTDNGAKFIITVPRSDVPPSTDLNISQALT